MSPEPSRAFEAEWSVLSQRLRLLLVRKRVQPSFHDDLIQETAVRLLSMWETVDRRRPLWPLTVTIALNLLRDRWRRRVLPHADIDGIPHLASSQPGPEQLVLADLDRAVIRAALASLPEDYQMVIRLRVLEARPSGEVAELMGRNADAIRQLQRRALIALRAALQQEALA